MRKKATEGLNQAGCVHSSTLVFGFDSVWPSFIYPEYLEE